MGHFIKIIWETTGTIFNCSVDIVVVIEGIVDVRVAEVVRGHEGLYALYKASFRPDSDKRQVSFVQTQTKVKR